MKKVLPILLLITVSISCSQNKNGITNKIKFYSEFNYNAKKHNGKIEQTKKQEEKKVYNYNKKGQLIKYELYFNDNGKQSVTSEIYLYDKKSYLSQTKKMRGKDTYTYDNKGQLIEYIEQYTTGQFKNRSTYKYDEMGNAIQYNTFNKDGSIRSKNIYKYNNKGNKIEALYYDNTDKKFVNKYTYKYDNKGNEIEEIYYSAGNKFESKETSKYDNKGNKIEALYYYNINNKLENKNIYEYDNNGNEIKEISYDVDDDGNLVKGDIITHLYDEKENIIKYTKQGKYRSAHKTYNYIYDEKGNWTKQIININDAVFFVKEREYLYY